MIVNLSRRTTQNIGDLRSAPARYFPFLSGSTALDLVDWEKKNRNIGIEEDPLRSATGIIVGGGGLLANDYFVPALERIWRLVEAGTPVALWGLGHNDWVLQDWRKMKYILKLPEADNLLIGVRDYGQKYPWVPCVSCMSQHFDRPGEPKHETVVYMHTSTVKRWPHTVEMFKDFPQLTNDADFEQAIEFLASGDLILTDSFHGAYWGTLLGRRVVAFPSSSKFYDLAHAVPLCHIPDWRRHAKLARRYPEALPECREANDRYAKKVKSFFLES